MFANVSELPNHLPEFECSECRDTLHVQVETVYRGNTITESKKCDCLLRKQQKRLLEKIPSQFRGVSLETLEARPEIHADQPSFVELMKLDPHGKFAISGDFGTGKTHFFWCLYEQAVKSNRRVWAGTASVLIDEFKKAIDASKAGNFYMPQVSVDELLDGREQWSLFLDDFDKVSPTEYVSEKLFGLIDACYSSGHQIVYTTNMRLEELEKRFNGTYGGAIVRRLLHYSHEIEMW